MKKFRKILQSAFSILMAFVLVFAMGCEGCASGSDGGAAIIKPAPEKPVPTFELDQSKIECIVGDFNKLAPKSLPDIGQATLTWRSENPDIVAVDSTGEIEAISAGTTNVIATYGTISASCTVNVSWDEELPQIISPASADGNFAIGINQEYSFAPTIQYRGKIYYDGQFDISVSNSAVTAFDAKSSSITGLAKGTSNVTISGTWRGVQTSKVTFSVSVSDNVYLDIVSEAKDGDQVSLFTQAKTFENTIDQITSCKILPTAKVNNDKVYENPKDFSIVVADEKIAKFDEATNTLEAKTFGETIATLGFNFEGQKFVKQYVIKIDRPLAQFRKEARYFSAYSGTLRDDGFYYQEKSLKEYIYGGQYEVIRTAYIGDQELEVEKNTGAIFGVPTKSDGVLETVIRVGTDVEQYDVQLKVYGQYIYNATDLDVFVRSAASPELNAYVELGRDVDLSDYVKPEHYSDISGSTDPNYAMIPTWKGSSNLLVSKGFTGTFDGKGYSLTNFNISSGHGLFGSLTGATIKNVGFINCVLNSDTFLSSFATNTTMENVYIQLNKMPKTQGYFGSGVISKYYSPGGSYTNVFIDLEQANLAPSYPVAQKHGRYMAEQFTSFLKFPTIGTAEQPVIKDCFVISTAPLSSITYDAYIPVRVVVAENTSEEDRVALRRTLWNCHNEEEKNRMIGSYKSYYNSNKNVYPNFEEFTDESLYIEYINNGQLAKYDNKVDRTSTVGRVTGVRSYATIAQMQTDSAARQSIETFSRDYWTVVGGQLTWGKFAVKLEDGDIFLDVGEEVRYKQVEGISLNPLKGNVAGDKVTIGALSCFGYIFDGWMNASTGKMLTARNGEYTLNYDGKATILIAQWHKDPNVQVDTNIK